MQQPLSERERAAAEDKLPPARIRKRAHLHNYIQHKAAGGESSLTRVQNDNCSPPQRQQQPANLFRGARAQTLYADDDDASLYTSLS
jgi:hypothetical protein